MGVVDWLKGAAKTVGDGFVTAGKGVAKGLDWWHQNVGQRVYDVAAKLPVVGQAFEAARPIFDTYGKALGAVNGRGSVSMDDLKSAVNAVPGAIAAGKGAYAGGKAAMANPGSAIRSGLGLA